MSKFNTKKVKAEPVINEMGEKAYQYKAVEELISTVMTTFLNDSYYESENEVTTRIKNCVDQVDPLFVAKLAIYARTDGKMRSSTHYLAALLADKISGQPWAKRFYKKVIDRPDDMSEILACYAILKGDTPKKVRKIHNAMRKGFRSYLEEKMDPYKIKKYKMESKDISLVDLVRLFRPRPTEINAKAYEALINGDKKSLNKLVKSKTLLTSMATESSKSDAIKAVLTQEKGAAYMELLRNLRNIVKSTPEMVDTAIKQLLTKDKVLKSKQLPFRFSTAYAAVEEVKYSDLAETETPSTSILFESDKPKISESEFNEIKSRLLKAIEKALEISCQNIPELPGENIAILVDHSGSVRGDAGGSSKVSAFSKVTTAMIGNLFGAMLASRYKNVYLGLFGDRLIQVPIERDEDGGLKGGILEFNKKSFDMGAKCGGSTEAGIYGFFRDAIQNKVKIDNLIVFSDCQIGDGGSTRWYGRVSEEHDEGFRELFSQFKKINPMMNFVEVNIKSTKGNSVFNPQDRILNISGWSDKIFDLLSSNLKGFKAMIEEINKIEI